jgi:hypothetical protein
MSLLLLPPSKALGFVLEAKRVKNAPEQANRTKASIRQTVGVVNPAKILQFSQQGYKSPNIAQI